ncbi:hypothetical protein RFI_09697 [Reticulomyxa filosa]|uniref:Uncharacterized protein n=1 Tax=Reticulomyxa filosa TaxID=46433 RepID=X6NMG4_RETFI|nr:hypothetical protein RFI_09697 [Reticulomyxa filosa]|eukprot:ETO27435.1 hypothetical protein RFI_09697 [Reticulomyxa filosa]
MLKNKQWKEYEIAFDYEHRRIVLLDAKTRKYGITKKKLNVWSLQVGNPKKQSLEFNVHIQWYNHSSKRDITTCTKWCGIILNHTWHFRTFGILARDRFSNCCAEFNSFHVLWKHKTHRMHKEPFNPYAIDFRQAIQCLQEKFNERAQFRYGANELLWFECELDHCKPPIPSTLDDAASLHDLYKHLLYYPRIQVYWKINGYCMVPYQHTIGINKDINASTSIDLDALLLVANKKPNFNPLLYQCDIQKFKLIQGNLHSIGSSSKDKLKKLLHEIIQNGYLCDLITSQNTQQQQRGAKQRTQGDIIIKQQLHFNKTNADELILNEQVLVILKKVKQLYNSHVHERMGYPLQLHEICALLLYCEISCNIEFSYDQIRFNHHKWKYLDMYLFQAIHMLHSHERREESNKSLYCGLAGVKLKSIAEIKLGYFVGHVGTCDDLKAAEIFRTDHGCILHFHPSMRRANEIFSCDTSWISPHKHGRKVLFARWPIEMDESQKAHSLWNANIEKEDEYTQTILLTWTKYDQFIQQAIQIRAIWSHSIDLNLIYVVLKGIQGNMDQKNTMLFAFDEWRKQDSNQMEYKQSRTEFLQRRCSNPHINLFCMYLFKIGALTRTAVKQAAIWTINDGLPFVDNDKNTKFHFFHSAIDLNFLLTFSFDVPFCYSTVILFYSDIQFNFVFNLFNVSMLCD